MKKSRTQSRCTCRRVFRGCRSPTSLREAVQQRRHRLCDDLAEASPLRRAYARIARTVLTGSLKVTATVGSTAGTGSLSPAACWR